MLSPPIDNFKCPESLFQIDRIKGNLPLDSHYITNFYFNHFVSVVIPDALMLPDSLSDDFTSKTDYYKVSNISISDLLNKAFLKYFICNGKLTLLSIKARIDCNNTIAITPKGELVLNIDRDTYHSLGIDGKISHFHIKLKNRYIVNIDLKEPNLQTDAIKLAKLKNKLRILEKCAVILSWEANDENICPSSIAKYIHDLGHDISVCNTNFNTNITYSIKVPVIDIEKADKEDIEDFLEWLGMLSIEGDLETDSPSNYVNSYTAPVPNVELGQVKCLQWTGLFTCEQIQGVISKFKDYNSKNNKAWISIYVQGFSDAPITWANEEQNYFTSGDNGYTIIFNQNDCVFCLYKTSRKRHK